MRQAPGFKGHLAHVGWPWYDEGVAVMSVTTGVFGEDPADWDLRVDLSFGSPTDWQLEVWQHCIDTLPPQMLMHGTDTFWPIDPEMYREQYLQPQLGLFETATTDERVGTVRDWSVLRVLCSEKTSSCGGRPL